MSTTRKRLDEALVAAGLAPSRSRARDMILRGTVSVGGAAETKPARMVAAGEALAVDDPGARYVSRGALKLIAGLDHFGFDPKGLTVLDIGASTGGFTQVFLERGASHVLALDVGTGQLDAGLASDPRVTQLEGNNARELTRDDLGGTPVEAIVCDVSFISLKLALPPALGLAEPGAWGIFLVKPQFEVGREAIGKGGIVRDDAAAEQAGADFEAWLGGQSWRVEGRIASPIAGGDGNREFLVGARRG